MPPYIPSSPLNPLRDQVIVLTGGAHGVGASLVTTLYRLGAHVVFGDIDEPACKELISSLTSSSPSSSTPGSLSYTPLDVRSYASNLALFQHAFALHSRIDHALSIAGVTEGENWFDPSLDLDTIKTQPSTSVLDINLLGALYFARIAAVYLRQNKNPSNGDKSLILTGSLASFKEQPGLFIYQPAKHGVLGLFRSVRKNLQEGHGIRTNIVCPGLIDTGMAGRVKGMWEKERLPINTAGEVAGFVLDMIAGGEEKKGLAVYVEGGKGWEFESELDKLEGQWMGEEMAENAARINDMLGVGAGWTKEVK